MDIRQLRYFVAIVEQGSFSRAAAQLGMPTTGAIHACDVGTGTCSVRADGLFMPAAITFDKWGGLWVLENHLAEPSVHRLP
mgnify:CR=1 FL=1